MRDDFDGMVLVQHWFSELERLVLANEPVSLQSGTTLGRDSVTAKIDEAGRGEVYRARDTQVPNARRPR